MTEMEIVDAEKKEAYIVRLDIWHNTSLETVRERLTSGVKVLHDQVPRPKRFIYLCSNGLILVTNNRPLTTTLRQVYSIVHEEEFTSAPYEKPTLQVVK